MGDLPCRRCADEVEKVRGRLRQLVCLLARRRHALHRTIIPVLAMTDLFFVQNNPLGPTSGVGGKRLIFEVHFLIFDGRIFLRPELLYVQSGTWRSQLSSVHHPAMMLPVRSFKPSVLLPARCCCALVRSMATVSSTSTVSGRPPPPPRLSGKSTPGICMLPHIHLLSNITMHHSVLLKS